MLTCLFELQELIELSELDYLLIHTFKNHDKLIEKKNQKHQADRNQLYCQASRDAKCLLFDWPRTVKKRTNIKRTNAERHYQLGIKAGCYGLYS